ncbi:MAG TPA: hypothetical protein VK213_05470 [Bacteroidales bacterium]|nr:hypothetical protein [Bacteroidales bacterium]
MTEKQKEFLRLAVENEKLLKYEEISKILNEPREVLSTWWDALKEEREKLAHIRSVWLLKCHELDYESFKKWYLETEMKCHYCGLTENDMMLLWQKYPRLTKRTRGRKLEIDRKQPDLPYSCTDNLVYCCYWCNNAKTDTFSEEEFLKVGKVIREIWKKRFDGTR